MVNPKSFHRSGGTFALQALKLAAVQGVVGDVRDQEERAEDKGGHHAVAVGGNAVVTHEVEAHEQGDGAEAVEQGVEVGQKGVVLRGGVGGGMDVDEPEEEERGQGADADDGSDGEGDGLFIPDRGLHCSCGV